jgi:predicted transcriptional regulator
MVRKKDIKRWMLDKDIRVQDVADNVGVSKSYVSHYLAGRKKAPKVREWLLGQGCPVKFLGEGKKEAA